MARRFLSPTLVPLPRWLPRLLRAAAACAVAATLPLAQAQAQDFPNKPIKIVVASAAGGASDILSRQLAERMQVLYGRVRTATWRPSSWPASRPTATR